MSTRKSAGRPPRLTDPVRFSVHLDGPVVAELDRIAKLRGDTRGEVIRTCIEHELGRISARKEQVPQAAPRRERAAQRRRDERS